MISAINFIAYSPATTQALYLADAFAPCDRTIVLYGETGTGKRSSEAEAATRETTSG